MAGSELGEVTVTYLEANNSYRTTTAEAHERSKQTNSNHQPSNENPQIATPNRRSKAVFFGQLITNRLSSQIDCLSGCLLGAALIASIINTFLLSFVIKSIQLNNKGLINGMVTWNEQSQSTMFQPFTKLSGKSISVNSIESLDEGGPLRLKLLPSGEHEYNDESSNKFARFLSSPPGQDSSSSSSPLGGDVQKQQSANYMALDYSPMMNNNINAQAKLRIGAKAFVLNLLLHRSNLTKLAAATTSVDDNNGHTRKKLLEFNEDQKSIELPIESKLQLSPKLAGSITVQDRLRSSQISGLLDEDLSVQARHGNLACQSEKAMKLISKAGNLRLTTAEEISVQVDQVQLVSSQLYLSGDGLQYIESDAQDDRLQSNSKQALKSLRGFDLVAIDGLLFASS